MVGKTWISIDVALGVANEENVRMISDSIRFANRVAEVLFDAEHFFDGYKANPDFAMTCIEAAYDAGAWIVLCDTNGGTLPHEIGEIVSEAVKRVPGGTWAFTATTTPTTASPTTAPRSGPASDKFRGRSMVWANAAGTRIWSASSHSDFENGL